jgi:DNA-binding PadR family transcriptional regulator
MGMWAFGWEMRKRRGLRIMVISALERGPRNGAEIIDDIESFTRGWWKPSPGSIYPLLESLVQEGLIAKKEDGRYELTQKARQEIGWSHPGGMHGGRPQSVEDMLAEIGGYVSYFEDLLKSNKARLDPHKARIREITERLSALGG